MGLAQRQPFGSTVIPIGADGEGRWPTDPTLEVGGPADLAVLRDDPRVPTGTDGRDLATRTLALVRGR